MAGYSFYNPFLYFFLTMTDSIPAASKVKSRAIVIALGSLNYFIGAFRMAAGNK